MEKRAKATFFALLMVAMSLSGCIGGETGVQGPEGPEGPPGPQGPPGEDGDSLLLVVAETDLPNCLMSLHGQIYFVSDEGSFYVCTTLGWSVVNLTGPAGQDGANGLDGEDGVDGDDGAPGADGLPGLDGEDGLSALALTTSEPPGAECSNGGVRIDVGNDINENGVLDAGEVQQTSFVCNGTNGASGGGPTTMLTSVAPTPSEMLCRAGGRVITQGLDNGDGEGLASNGILEDGEVDYSATYCSNYALEGYLAPDLFGFYPWYQFVKMDGIFYTHAYINGSSSNEIELWAFDPSLDRAWQVSNFDYVWANGGGLRVVHDSTLYFDSRWAVYDRSIYAYNSGNRSTWEVANLSTTGTLRTGLMGSAFYFSADDGISGEELWAHDVTNGTTWQVANLQSGVGNSRPGRGLDIIIGDTIYFDAQSGSSGCELWAHNTSNGTTWRVVDINPTGSSNPGFGTSSSGGIVSLIGTTLYFPADDGTHGIELWAYNLMNDTAWRISDINSGSADSYVGEFMFEVVGDEVYFSAYDTITGIELWAYNTSNHTVWLALDLNEGQASSQPGKYLNFVDGDRIYFSGHQSSQHGQEVWVYDTSDGTHWILRDFNPGSGSAFDLYGSGGGVIPYLAHVGDVHLITMKNSSNVWQQNDFDIWAIQPSTNESWMVMNNFYWAPRVAYVEPDGSAAYIYQPAHLNTHALFKFYRETTVAIS